MRRLLMMGRGRSYVDEYDALSGALQIVNAGAAVGVSGGALKATTLADVGPTLLTDGALENWASATNLTSWTESVAGTSTVNREDSDVHGGAHAARFDVDGSSSAASIQQSIENLILGAYLRAHVWAKRSASPGSVVVDLDRYGTTPVINKEVSSSYSKYSSDLVGPIDYSSWILRCRRWQENNTSLYVDDLDLRLQAALINDARLTGIVNGWIGRTIEPPTSPSVTPYAFWLRNDGTGLNGIRVRLTPNTAGLDTEIWQVVAGVATSRGTADADWATGDTCWVEMRGATVTVYRQAAGGATPTQLVQWTAATTPGPYNGHVFYGTSWGISREVVRA